MPSRVGRANHVYSGFFEVHATIDDVSRKQKFAVGTAGRAGCEQKLALGGQSRVLVSNGLGVVISLEAAHDEMSARHSLEMVDEKCVYQRPACRAEYRNRLRGRFL